MERSAFLRVQMVFDTGCAMVDGSAHKCEPDQEGSRRPCEGEGDTQDYALPLRSGSQTAARVSITETHFHKIHPVFSFRILSLVLVTAASASIPTPSACIPIVFNNPLLFSQMQAAP